MFSFNWCHKCRDWSRLNRKFCGKIFTIAIWISQRTSIGSDAFMVLGKERFTKIQLDDNTFYKQHSISYQNMVNCCGCSFKGSEVLSCVKYSRNDCRRSFVQTSYTANRRRQTNSYFPSTLMLLLTFPVPGPWPSVSPPTLPASSSASQFPASGQMSAPSPRPAESEESCPTKQDQH